MKKSLYGLFGSVLIFSFLVIWSAGVSHAGISVSINFGPPPLAVSEPPELIMMPGMNIYYVPSFNFDIFYYDGYWWSPRGPKWYRARSHNGPWGVVQRSYVPGPLFRVPKNYRDVYKKERPVHFADWKQKHQVQNKNEKNKREKDGHGNGRGRKN